MSQINALVSLVLPVRNPGPDFIDALEVACKALAETFSDYEILIVDNMNGEDAEARLSEAMLRLPSIRHIALSSFADKDITTAAGLDNAIGDVIVLADLTREPMDVILEAARRVLDGDEVIMGVSQLKPATPYRQLSHMFHRLFARLANYRMPRNVTPFRALSRRALIAIVKHKRFQNRLSSYMTQTGYRTVKLKYMPLKPVDRHMRDGFRRALSLLIYNSIWPLRMMSALGILGGMLGVTISAYSFLIHLFKEQVIEGWTSMTIFISAQFTLMFLILFVFSEYLARLVQERREAEGYDVRFERTSSVMMNEAIYNVLDDPTSQDLAAIQTGRNR